VIEVQGLPDRQVVRDPGAVPWVFVGPEPKAGAVGWIGYRWNQAVGQWSISDDGVLARWPASHRQTVVKTWMGWSNPEER
jgi:hypothetical protein